MAKFLIGDFTRYEIDVNKATRDELAEVVRRAAKAANTRLLRLERAGRVVGAYKVASRELGLARARFRERTTNMPLPDLRKEYRQLKRFMTAKTSTIRGQKQVEELRYETAVKHGYKGTLDQFIIDVTTVFGGKFSSNISSDVLYDIMVEGEIGILDEIRKEAETREVSDVEQEIYRKFYGGK